MPKQIIDKKCLYNLSNDVPQGFQREIFNPMITFQNSAFNNNFWKSIMNYSPTARPT